MHILVPTRNLINSMEEIKSQIHEWNISSKDEDDSLVCGPVKEGWEGSCTTGTPLRHLFPGGAPRQRTRKKRCPVVSARMLGKGVQQW